MLESVCFISEIPIKKYQQEPSRQIYHTRTAFISIPDLVSIFGF